MASRDFPAQNQPVGPAAFSALEWALLDDYQRGFPLVSKPYQQIAEAQGVSEREVLATYRRLSDAGYISRIGAAVRPHRAGWSTLAAMAVPPADLAAVADLVSAFPEVNHNYEREHRLNLWFVVAAADRDAVAAVLATIERQSGLEVLDLPMEQAFRVDLGFPLR